jgi:beta-lactamase superfamily II metal-dependent hydrolase
LYDVDFLPVENEDSSSTHSGDAIVMRFSVEGWPRPAVVVIDAGFTAVGEDVVNHLATYYGTSTIDLVISTHPDADHINGLKTVVQQCTVGELMMHLPWLHRTDLDDFSNYEAVGALYETAQSRGVVVTEPFTGASRFSGALTILGPTLEFYEERLDEYLGEERSGVAKSRREGSSTLFAKAADLLQRAVLSVFPSIETLSNDDDSGPRNKMSVVTFIDAGGHRMLFTGDAGISSIAAAGDEYEARIGAFQTNPLHLFQPPHHGSHHNLGPDILDRLLGPRGREFGPTTSVISSAKSSPKHPSPKVTNALGRRGSSVYATEGRTIAHQSGTREGWSTAPLVPALVEDVE